MSTYYSVRLINYTQYRGVDSFFVSGGDGSSVRGMICPPGLSRVN